jgi:hypothetical protein
MMGQTNRKFVALAGISFSSVEVFNDCSGGNSRPSYLLWCGGRSFFDRETDSRGSDQQRNFDFFLGFLLPCRFYFPFSLICILSVRPKGTCRPPLTSCSRIGSSRRINLSLVRLRLFPGSAAGAFFCYSVYSPWPLLLSASVPNFGCTVKRGDGLYANS